jgi:hypothetical protein
VSSPGGGCQSAEITKNATRATTSRMATPRTQVGKPCVPDEFFFGKLTPAG